MAKLSGLQKGERKHAKQRGRNSAVEGRRVGDRGSGRSWAYRERERKRGRTIIEGENWERDAPACAWSR